MCCWLWTYSTRSSSVSIADFKQISVSWELSKKGCSENMKVSITKAVRKTKHSPLQIQKKNKAISYLLQLLSRKTAFSKKIKIALLLKNRVLTSRFNFWNKLYMMFCAIWYHLYNFKNMNNTYGGVLLY